MGWILHKTENQISPTCTVVTPTVLKVSIHSTEYPPRYWCYPHSADVISHCTEQPPQYWSYPAQFRCYSPDVLNSLQCTEQPTTVLNRRHMEWMLRKLKESREGRNGSRGLRSKTRVWSKARVDEGRAWSSSFLYQLWNTYILSFALSGNELNDFSAWTPLSHFVIQRWLAGFCTRRKIKFFSTPMVKFVTKPCLEFLFLNIFKMTRQISLKLSIVLETIYNYIIIYNFRNNMNTA